ncbi:glycosyltransferase family 2 protein [Paraflavisolibacter sp. H34]|uniref:glycosyltransferase family 2 protein n=1 Tax=Huijunlia imazamoxiresistens TaxID=3127457 RepID=UPI003018AF5D
MVYQPLSVIILTCNESKNIRDCLESVKDLTDDIIIVDSGSTDDTLEIAAQYTQKLYHHPFENYSRQRNWAFAHVDCKYEWIFNMDADHRLTVEIKTELAALFQKGVPADIRGFMASRRTMFMNRWIRHGGHYPVYHGVIFKKGYGACEEKEYDQHFLIKGKSMVLQGDVEDIITDSLNTFISRHNKWATLESRDILDKGKQEGKIKPCKNGNLMEQRRYQRMRYYSYPRFWRVFLYFFYRFVIKGGFRDGKEGLIFHFLQGFWFRFLVDAKLYELETSAKAAKKQVGVLP